MIGQQFGIGNNQFWMFGAFLVQDAKVTVPNNFGEVISSELSPTMPAYSNARLGVVGGGGHLHIQSRNKIPIINSKDTGNSGNPLFLLHPLLSALDGCR
jgi:hypothetical protein